MINDNGNELIKIRDLPEKFSLSKDDFLISEDLTNTWKFKADLINRYIDNQIEILQENLNASVNNIQNKVNDLNLSDDDRNIKIEDIKKLIYLKSRSSGTSLIASDNSKLCNLATISVKVPAESDIQFPKYYSAVFSIDEFDSSLRKVNSSVVYICLQMKPETYTYYENGYISITKDSTCETSQISMSLDKDKVNAYIQYSVVNNGNYIEYTLLSDNSSSFFSPTIYCEVHPNQNMVALPITTNIKNCLNYEDFQRTSAKDYGYERRYYEDTSKIKSLELRQPEYSYPIGSIYVSSTSTNPNTILGGGSWQYIDGTEIVVDTLDDTNKVIKTETKITYRWLRVE